MNHKYSNLAKNQLFKWLVALLVPAVIFLCAFAAVSYRSSSSPDIFTDEILYTRVGTRIAGEGALVWDSGTAFMIHPPLYFLTEGAYLSLTSNPRSQVLDPGNIYTDVYHARTLNAIFAGLTAVFLFIIARRLRGFWPGLLIAALFVIDPFGVRINRRAMMETLAELITFAGMGLFAINLMRSNPKYSLSLWAGLLLGAGLLTKELTFISLLAVALFGLWEFIRSILIKPNSNETRYLFSVHALLVIATALLTYGVYPVWVISEGQWALFLREKLLGLQRLIGLIQLTGWNRPGVTLSQFLLARLTDYGSSYILLALGGLATFWILINQNRAPLGRLIASWGLVLYPFFAFTALVGSGNDQFFYYLLVPAIFLVGYAVSLPSVFTRYHKLQNWLRLGITVLILVGMVPYNVYQWVKTFGSGQDNAYYQLAQYADSSLPTGAPINATGDPIKFRYFLPSHPITTVATPDQALLQGVHFYALAPKDVQSHYGNITDQMENWIETNGTLLAHFSGNSYGDIYLYRVDFVGGKNSTLAEVSLAAPGHWRMISPAQGNFTGPFIILILVWLLLVGGAFGIIIYRYFDILQGQLMKGADHARETRRV
jgi:hypothetical protein